MWGVAEIDCGHPGNLSNGWLDNIEQGTALGSSIIFRCYPNMTIEGDQSTVCQADGSWSRPLPMCLGESSDRHGKVQPRALQPSAPSIEAFSNLALFRIPLLCLLQPSVPPIPAQLHRNLACAVPNPFLYLCLPSLQLRPVQSSLLIYLSLVHLNPIPSSQVPFIPLRLTLAFN